MAYPLPPIDTLDRGARHRCVALLGDSIFDNASNVSGKPAVIQQLEACLPAPWQGLLLAVDGAVTQDWILEQYGEFEKNLSQGPGQVHHSVLNQLDATDPADLGRKMLDS